MNCKQCQQKIVDALAAGSVQKDQDVSGHQSSCPACAAFYEMQRNLFHSLDTGLRSLANQPVPPSLLPSVRVRLGHQPVLQRAWLSSWSTAVVATVTILAVSLGYMLHRPPSPPTSQPNLSIASRRSVDPNPAVRPHGESPSIRPKTKRAVRATPSTHVPEVIILSEEQRAFAKFVADVPEEPAVALALNHPSPPPADSSSEIALLQIDSLEVKPLESTAKD